MSQINGHISQIIGPVIDVYFDTQGQDPEKVLPKIYEAMKVTRPDGKEVVIEVEQHIGEDTVRCIAMDSTDGLERGLEVVPTGAPIQMPCRRPDSWPYDERDRSAYRWYETPRHERQLSYPPSRSKV